MIVRVLTAGAKHTIGAGALLNKAPALFCRRSRLQKEQTAAETDGIRQLLPLRYNL